MTSAMQTVAMNPRVATRVAAALACAVPATALAHPGHVATTMVVSGHLARTQISPDQLVWGNLHRDLGEWAMLPLDWDGDDGIAPPPLVIENARGFLRLAQQAGLSAPVAYVAGDGEVGYSWETATGFASVSFLKDGAIVGKVRAAGRPTFRIDEPFAEDANTGALFRRIAEIA